MCERIDSVHVDLVLYVYKIWTGCVIKRRSDTIGVLFWTWNPGKPLPQNIKIVVARLVFQTMGVRMLKVRMVDQLDRSNRQGF